MNTVKIHPDTIGSEIVLAVMNRTAKRVKQSNINAAKKYFNYWKDKKDEHPEIYQYARKLLEEAHNAPLIVYSISE